MEVDISSYKQAEGKSPIEIASEFGNLKRIGQSIERTDIGIASDQLKLMNEKWGIINNELRTMISDPNASQETISKRMQNLVNQRLLTPQQYGEFIKTIPTDPTQIKPFLEQSLARGQSVNEAINWHYGEQGEQSNQQGTLAGKRDVRTGGFTPSTITPQQIPPTANTVEQGSGQPRMYGTQPPQSRPVLPVGPPGAGASPPPGNVTSERPSLPVEPLKAVGPPTAATPMFDEGKRMLAADQEMATQKLTAIKPAMQTLPYLKDIMAGPGTEQFTKAVAALKAFGIVPTGTAENDATAIRQIVNKKLADYLRSNPVGQRSDAAQVLSETASPSAKEQITPALIKLTKDAIVLDRVQAARAAAFEDQDYSKYGNHRVLFTGKVDERAFGLDLMEPDKRKELVQSMQTKLKKNPKDFEANKFFRSLDIVDKQGLIDTSQ